MKPFGRYFFHSEEDQVMTPKLKLEISLEVNLPVPFMELDSSQEPLVHVAAVEFISVAMLIKDPFDSRKNR